jgi:hypothetical protein
MHFVITDTELVSQLIRCSSLVLLRSLLELTMQGFHSKPLCIIDTSLLEPLHTMLEWILRNTEKYPIKQWLANKPCSQATS